MNSYGTGITDRGASRIDNEDALLVDDDNGLYIVADGMGGHAAGEVAATLAVETISRWMGKHRALIASVRDGDVDQSELLHVAEGAFVEASRVIYDRAISHTHLAGMATTATMLLVLRNKAIMAHVGDTRLYLMRDSRAHQISSDHTIACEFVKMGTMEMENARHSHLAHILSRAIGTQQSVRVDTLLIDTQPGDVFILTTDGLSDHLASPSDLIGSTSRGFEEIPTRLLDLANAAAGDDNTTVVAVRIEASGSLDEENERREHDPVETLAVLGKNVLLEGLTLAHIARILEVSSIEAHGTGETLLGDGDPLDCMYVVLEGRLGITRNGVKLAEIVAGDHVGDTTLLTRRRALATIETLEPSRVLRIDGATFEALVHRWPHLGVTLLVRLCRRFDWMLNRAYDRMDSTPGDSRDGILEPYELV